MRPAGRSAGDITLWTRTSLCLLAERRYVMREGLPLRGGAKKHFGGTSHVEKHAPPPSRWPSLWSLPPRPCRQGRLSPLSPSQTQGEDRLLDSNRAASAGDRCWRFHLAAVPSLAKSNRAQPVRNHGLLSLRSFSVVVFNVCPV